MGRATGSSGTSATSHPITLPAHTTGDTLFVIFSGGWGTDKTVSIDTGLSTSGWTQGGTANNSITAHASWYTKVAASGAEVLVLSLTAGDQSTHISLALQGATTISGTSANRTGTNHDPPSHTPAGGTQDYLWLVTRSAFGTSPASAPPASFSDQTSVTPSGGSGATTDLAEQELNASVLDPGAWTNANTVGVVWTIAVRP